MVIRWRKCKLLPRIFGNGFFFAQRMKQVHAWSISGDRVDNPARKETCINNVCLDFHLHNDTVKANEINWKCRVFFLFLFKHVIDVVRWPKRQIITHHCTLYGPERLTIENKTELIETTRNETAHPNTSSKIQLRLASKLLTMRRREEVTLSIWLY